MLHLGNVIMDVSCQPFRVIQTHGRMQLVISRREDRQYALTHFSFACNGVGLCTAEGESLRCIVDSAFVTVQCDEVKYESDIRALLWHVAKSPHCVAGNV
jgi:hypothetical protein